MNEVQTDNDSIELSVLGRNYSVKCSPDQTQELRDAVLCVNRKIEQFSSKAPSQTPLNIVLSAALDLACEVLRYESKQSGHIDLMGLRLQEIEQKIEEALARDI